jgi:flagellar basal body-associated protein FliL
MKQVAASPSAGLIVYRGIVVLLLALIVMLLGGSLYALVRTPESGPLFRIGTGNGKSGATGKDGGLAAAGTTSEFSGIGRLRISINDQAVSEQTSAAVILSISFPYPVDDRPFTEELASRIGEFRSIAAGYFASLPREKILELDEETAKHEILRDYNALLRLGKIETLYFSDFMIIE